MRCTPEGGGWGNGAGNADYTVYFYAQFSKPLKNYGIWRGGIPEGQIRKLKEIESIGYDSLIAKSKIIKGFNEIEGKHLGFYSEFETHRDEQVFVKSGISFASMEGAKENLGKEIPLFDFDKVKSQAESL